VSTTELKQIVDESTAEERLFLQAYLDHLPRVNDPANAADLSKRMREMDEGKKVTLAQAKAMCL
jgi:hypothetical protein